MKKYLWIFPLLMLVLAGCKSAGDEDSITVYYLNLDGTCVEQESVSKENLPSDTNQMVELLLNLLQTDPLDSNYRKTIPDNIKIKEYNINGYMLFINFSKEYNKLSPTEEVLIRAAIVKTMVQLDECAYVTFSVEGAPLVNMDGVNVGSMNADSFIENTGDQINTSLEEDLTLYFATSTGNNLVKQTSTVRYSTNKSLEKVVIEKLMEGPDDSGLLGTIPQGTNLISINVVDGICYVNFDETFTNNQTDAITEEAVLFSIVNSLCSLDYIDRVQIQIKGNTDGMLRYNYELDTTYSANTRLVINLDEDEAATEALKETETN